MKKNLLKKLIATVSLSLAVVLGASSVASAYFRKEYEYDDEYGGTLEHVVCMYNNGDKCCSAYTKNWRYGRLRGSYTRIKSFGPLGGLHVDTERQYSEDGHESSADGHCGGSCRGYFCTYNTCDECTALGAELPKYEIIGTGLRVYFPALKSALIDQPKAPKHQNTDKHGALDNAMVLRIIEKLKEQPDISQETLGESIGVTRRVVQKYINVLKESGRIERVGGKRYGHWGIND